MYARLDATRISLHQIGFASENFHRLLNQQDISLCRTRQSGTVIRTPIQGVAELLAFLQDFPGLWRVWRAAGNGIMRRGGGKSAIVGYFGTVWMCDRKIRGRQEVV